MAQHDQIIGNDTGANVRADINALAAALFSNSSGSSAPGTTIAYQLWADTTNGLLKIRNASNSAWITLGAFDASEFRFLPGAGAVGTPAFSANSDTNTGVWFPTADVLALSTGGAERVRVDATGNVSAGVATAQSKLHLHGPTSVFARFSNSATGSGSGDGAYVGIDTAGVAYVFNIENQPVILGTNNGERLRIDADGDVVIGGASASDWTTAAKVAVEVSTGRAMSLQNTGASGGCLVARVDNTGAAYASFYSGAGEVGSITTNGSATFYNTASDARLKTAIVDLPDSGWVIDAIRPRVFNWIASGQQDVGFVAQELATVVPGAVTVGSVGDLERDEQGVARGVWQVDASRLLPYVIGELQALRARLAAIEAR